MIRKPYVYFGLVFFLVAIFSIQATAADQELLFEQANEAYSRGEFDEAVQNYLTIITNKGYSASVLNNLASSYAQKGEIGKAILNFERAAILVPSDPDIVGNLAKVRKESGLFQQDPAGIDRFFNLLGLNQWTVLILAGLLLLAFFILATLRFKFARITHYLVYISGCMLLITGISGTIARFQDFNPSVVIATDAKLLISPFDSASSIGAINEGRLVYPQKLHGHYSLVIDGTGRKGWLESTKIEPVVQPARERK